MEIDYNELFDIETGAEIAENAPEEAQEAAQERRETEDGQEHSREEQPKNGQETAREQPKKPEQTPEERARQAEGRRLREREEAGRKAERAEFSAVISRLGLTDPETGEAVDDYEKLKAYEVKQSRKRLQAGTPTEADIRRIVREERQAQTEQREAVESAGEDPRIQAELEEIRRLDPEMTDLGTILRSEVGEKFRSYVRRGLGFLEAYKLAGESRISSMRQKSAAEAARVQAASKDHLSSTRTQGTGAVSVPRDVESQYRLFFPEASQAEIQRMYAADQKKYGKK